MKFFEQNYHHLIFPIAIAVGVSLFVLAVRSVVFRLLKLQLKKKHNSILEAFIGVVRVPSIYWCLAVGAYTGVAIIELSDKYAKPLVQFIHVMVILSITDATANLCAALFRHFMRKVNRQHRVSGLALGMIKGIIFAIGLSTILTFFGVSIAPLLTALGVGGLAVALALKDTLENIFAGVYLLTDGTIRVGDYVRLESGQEGKVLDIGWRTTRILVSANNLTIIPNNKLAQSLVTNFCLPENRVGLSIPITIKAVDDTAKVLELLNSVAKLASEDVVGVLTTQHPSVHFTQIGNDGTLTFQINLQTKDFSNQAQVAHEIRRRVYSTLISAGIPFPERPTIKV